MTNETKSIEQIVKGACDSCKVENTSFTFVGRQDMSQFVKPSVAFDVYTCNSCNTCITPQRIDAYTALVMKREASKSYSVVTR